MTNKYVVIKNVKLAKSSILGDFGRVGVGVDRRYVGFTGGIVAINKGALYGCANSGAVTLNSNSDLFSIGGIVGENRGSVDNCTNSGAVTLLRNSVGDDVSIGGIVGRNVGNSAVVKSCVNEGTVTSTGDNVGGIVGRYDSEETIEDCTNRGTISGSYYVGGIAGCVRWGNIKSCVNEGSVTSTGDVGGIAGFYVGDVKSCMNEGSVIGTDTLSLYGVVGGIVGNNYSGEIVDCLNSGFVPSTSGKLYSGGIVGSNGGTISVCTNYGLVEGKKSAGIVGYNSDGGNFVGNAKVTDCRNLILISKSRARAGLVYQNTFSTIRNSFSVVDEASGIYDNDEGIVANCYFDSAVFRFAWTGGYEIAMSTSDMQSDRLAWILNTTNGEVSNSEIWSRDSVGYPVFADSLHKPIYKVVLDNGRDSMDCFTNYKGLIPFPSDPEQPGKLFRGWFTEDGDKIDSLTVFSKDQTVYAAYTDLYFSIRFFDSDSSLLDSQYVKYGDMPSDVVGPTKDSTAQYIYIFHGWYMYPVTRDFDYYAAYSEIVRYYMIRFLNDDGVVLQSLNIAYGTLPVYSGPIPKKASSDKYEYIFSGWSPTLKTVTGEVAYTAVFDSTRIISQAVPVTVAAPTWSVTAAGRNFQIHAAPVGKSYALFDLQGKVLAKGRIESSEMTISAPRAGSYIVRIGNRSVRMNAR